MKLLIVDDDPDLVKSLARILRAAGLETEYAYDGESAVSKNLAWEPDAVLMDIRMPRMNGIEATLEMLNSRPEVFILLMTGFSAALDEANQGILSQACQNHRVELLMKPLDPDQLIEQLQSR